MFFPLNPVSFPENPTNSILPFSYREGLSYLNRLERLAKYINKVVVPYVNDSYTQLSGDIEDEINGLIVAVNAAIQSVINSSVEVQDPIVADIIANAESLTHTALVNLFGDDAVAEYVNNNLSPTRTALDALYGTGAMVSKIEDEDNPIRGALNDLFGDDAIAALMSNPTATKTAVDNLINALSNGKYIVHRVWNGVSYPARIAGAVNAFIGPDDPGLAMSENDFWARDDYVTLAQIASELANPASPVAVSAFANAVPDSIFLTAEDFAPIDSRPATKSNYDPTGTAISAPAWFFDNGVQRYVGTIFQVPKGWNSAYLELLFAHNSAAAVAGNISFYARMGSVDVGSNIGTVPAGETVAVNAAAQKVIQKTTHMLAAPAAVSASRLMKITIARNGNTDTFAYPTGLIGVLVKRAS